MTHSAESDAHAFVWDVIGYVCRCGKWRQRFGPLADAQANHAAHVAECVTPPEGGQS